ncbi:hypothetical protein KP509_09G087800 [Ceratopteris richardii]|nr:hypothetical protein KP509_09G087800 [Ceratopteris richardii]
MDRIDDEVGAHDVRDSAFIDGHFSANFTEPTLVSKVVSAKLPNLEATEEFCSKYAPECLHSAQPEKEHATRKIFFHLTQDSCILSKANDITMCNESIVDIYGDDDYWKLMENSCAVDAPYHFYI